MRRIVFGITIVLLLAPRAAHAQDPPKVGLVLGFPTNLGVLWNMSTRMALRPEIVVIRTSNDTTITTVIGNNSTTTVSAVETWQVGGGASALFYLAKPETLRTYFAPRLTYTRSNTNNPASLSGTIPDSVTTFVLISGSFGAQYAMGRRFSVFAETGVAYQRSKSSVTSSSFFRPDTTASTVGPRGSIGAILFFGE